MRIHRALALLLLALPGLGSAQTVFKCTDADGHVKFSQSPCKGDPHAAPKSKEPVQGPPIVIPEPTRVEKASPGARAGAAPSRDPAVQDDTTIVDGMGRPDVSKLKQEQDSRAPAK